jgi:hypothetical protein
MNELVSYYFHECFFPPLLSMGTLVVEELVKELVKKLVGEKHGQKFMKISPFTKDVLPSYVGRIAKLCMGSCHPM